MSAFFLVILSVLPWGAVGPSGWALGSGPLVYTRRWARWGRPAAQRRAMPKAGQRDCVRAENQSIGQMRPGQIDALLRTLADAPLEKRIARWSALFLGTPYHLDPLGEGKGATKDSDPLIDFSRVDCITFVEQVMALAYARRYDEVLSWMLRLRYHDADPQFDKRYYTMIKGWIRAHRKAGLLVDVTRKVGQSRVRRISVSLRPRPGWHELFRKRFKALGALAPRGRARIDYIPLRAAMERAERFPVPSLMHVVSERLWRSPYLVTHTGLIVSKDGKRFFRHASRSPQRMEVEDRRLVAYLEMLRRYYGRHGRRRVLGVNLTRIMDPPNRIAPVRTNPSPP